MNCCVVNDGNPCSPEENNGFKSLGKYKNCLGKMVLRTLGVDTAYGKAYYLLLGITPYWLWESLGEIAQVGRHLWQAMFFDVELAISVYVPSPTPTEFVRIWQGGILRGSTAIEWSLIQFCSWKQTWQYDSAHSFSAAMVVNLVNLSERRQELQIHGDGEGPGTHEVSMSRFSDFTCFIWSGLVSSFVDPTAHVTREQGKMTKQRSYSDIT